MDSIDKYRELINSLIGYQEWEETDYIDELQSLYSIKSERGDYSDEELVLLSAHLNIDLNSKDSYYSLEDGII